MTNAVNIAQGGSNNVTMRNRLINGQMQIAQRGAGPTNNTQSTGLNYDTVDRWGYWANFNNQFTTAQSTTAPAGFSYSSLITSLAATSQGSATYATYSQRIEGYNIADLNWGSSNAKPVTVSFWIRSSLTGTFSAYVFNSGYAYCFPFTFSIPSANTWVQITQTIIGPTSGTWLTTNGIGLEFGITLLNGTSYQAASGAWTTTPYAIGVSGSVNLLSTNGATMNITGVQLEAGSTASPFEYRQYGTELALCQRYYYRFKAVDSSTMFGSGLSYSGTAAIGVIKFPVSMRTNPTALEQSGSASDYRIQVTGGVFNCTSVPTFDSGCYDTASVNFPTSGMSGGQGILLRALTSNAYLGWSAEL
jgi:hypothetical protein